MGSVNKRAFEIRGYNDAPIRGDIFDNSEGERKPVVVFCHGFKGFKDWGPWSSMATELAKAGLVVVTFNFSHNGVGEDLENFTELDKFRANTASIEQGDLRCVVNSLKDILPASADTSSVGLVGHSRGGPPAVVVGAEDARVKKVATLAGVADPKRFTEEQVIEWREKGVIHILNSRTGQQLPLGIELLEDIENNPDFVEQSARKLNKPLLVIHGDKDPVVDVSEAKMLESWAEKSSLKIIPGADHTFGAKHPYKEPSKDFDLVVRLLKVFFCG